MNAQEIIEMIQKDSPPSVGTSSELFDEIKEILSLEEIEVTEESEFEGVTLVSIFREITLNSTKIITAKET